MLIESEIKSPNKFNKPFISDCNTNDIPAKSHEILLIKILVSSPFIINNIKQIKINCTNSNKVQPNLKRVTIELWLLSAAKLVNSIFDNKLYAI